MHRLVLWVAMLAAVAATVFCSGAPALAQSRVALVISNSAYQGAPPIATAIADASLITTTLQAAGYDVTQYADLTTQTMGAAFGPFIEKIKSAGPDAIVFVYFSGYAVQGNGDDYLVPVDTQINTADNAPDATMSLSSVMKALTDVQSAARIIVIDGARDGGFGKAGGQPVPPGLALTAAPPGVLLAYSAAPGTYAPEVSGDNSPYANALATLMRQPGLDIEQIFKGVRLQVNQATNGLQTPWMTSALNVDVKLFAAPAASAAAPKDLAPALGVAGIAVPPPKRHVTKSSMRRMSADEGYQVAIEQDSLPDYQWFVEAHPEYPRAGQIWDIITGRREEILWRRALVSGTTRAYWNYLDRYPDGVHAYSARRWLDDRGAPLPSNYVAIPEELPSGYYDEAIGLPDLVPRGFDAPPPVFFGGLAPEFVRPPPRWHNDRPINITIKVPPPPPNRSGDNVPLVTKKKDVTRQIVGPPPDAVQKKLENDGKKSLAPVINSEQLRQEILKQLAADTKKAQDKAAADAAKAAKEAKEASLGATEPPVLLKPTNQPNRWQQLLAKREAEKNAKTKQAKALPVRQGKAEVIP